LEQARELGISSLDRRARDYGLSLALGSGEVTLLELTGAFRVFANGGKHTPASGIHRVTGSLGRVFSTQPAPVQALSPATAYQITDILSDNVARTPAFGANNILRLPVPAAVKTGTTTDFRDNWTVGYTRHLVVGVWTGNSDGTPLRGSSGVSGAGPLWRNFMLAAVEDEAARSRFGLPLADDAWTFTPPPDVTVVDICPPDVTCRAGGEYFSAAWLERTPPGNPIADSVVTEVVVPTHRDAAGNSYWFSYCSPDEEGVGVLRTLSRLSGLVGLQQPKTLAPAPDNRLSTAMQQVQTAEEQPPSSVVLEPIIYYPDSELELFRQLGSALNRGSSVFLGRCADLNYYTVRSGDSWTSLARSVGLRVAELQAANLQVLRQSGYLFIGDRLLFPKAVVISDWTDSILHTVAEGESWTFIATRYDLPLRLLLTANPEIVRPFYILRPGDRLQIPISLSQSSELR
jgi:hypothetical protein